MKTMRHLRLWALLGAAGTACVITPALAQDSLLDPQGAEQAPQIVTRDWPALFVPATAPANATPHRQAKAWTAVTPNLSVLASVGIGDTLVLNCSATETFTLVVTHVEHRADNDFSVRGRLKGFEDSSALFAVMDDALACDITAPPAGIHYKTKYGADGVHFICEMDDDKYAPCAGSKTGGIGPDDEDFEPEPGEAEGIDPTDSGGRAETGTCSAPLVVFDAMIVYSNVARTDAGGTSAIQAECQLAIDRTNESYENSPISARMRLVRRYEVAYDEVRNVYDDHLDRLTGTNGMGGSGIWPGIRSNRDTFNADFCTLWVDDGAYCGLAWCTSAANRGYSVVTWDCAAGNLSHPHEIGHNQGCAHDPDNDGGGCGAYSYSFGHRFFGTNGTQYRTVMAYSPGSRIPYFSNPSQTYQGTATGTSTRDNERTIENRKSTCEGFESTRWDIWVDFSYAGPFEFGFFSFPYNTVTEGVANIDDWVSGASEYPNLYIFEGSSSWTGTISKTMDIRACGGPVTIGQ